MDDEIKAVIVAIVAAAIVFTSLIAALAQPNAEAEACIKAGKSWVVSDHSYERKAYYECR